MHDALKFVIEKNNLIILGVDGKERSARIEKRERVQGEEGKVQRASAALIFEAYSLPLKIAAITRGFRRPCITATTQRGFSSGA